MEKDKIVREINEELAAKVWNDIKKRNYEAKVSKDFVLRHLKQVKAEMGKLKAKYSDFGFFVVEGVEKCMEIIDKKIEKINRIN